MADKLKERKKKPGPDPERLVIEEDPSTALDRLLKVVRERVEEATDDPPTK